MRHRLLAVVSVATALVLSGCGAADDTIGSPASPGASSPSASSTTASVDPKLVPGSTLDASAVSEEAPQRVRLAVVAPARSGGQERAALDAIDAFADRNDGSVVVHPNVDAALADDADVIVSIGPSTVGAIDLASAANLDASFLVLGSQLAEPTGNVIAVVWPGADQRAVFADEEHPFAAADAYAERAIETGLAAFASGLDGHVIALD